MKAFLLTVFFGFLFFYSSPYLASEIADNQKPRICYFQLTESEYQDTEADKLQQNLSNVEVKSYTIGSKSPTKAFKDMVEENKKCNALVISGHHAGDFASEKTGALHLKFIEKLSCNPEYKDWFDNVKALYLHGCNTVKDEYLQGIRDKTQPATETGDKASLKENAVGKLNINWDDSNAMKAISHSYANTLDEHTPLSSRYMRAFPNTDIYGFAEKAQMAGGDKDVFEHIKKVAQALAAENESIKNISKADQFLEALNTLTAEKCDKKNLGNWEGTAVANRKYAVAQKLGCDLINAKQVLNNSKSTPSDRQKARKKIIEALEQIVSEDQENTDSSLSHLLINNIHETVMLADKLAKADNNTKDTQFVKNIEKILKGEYSQFKATLQDKMNSPILPSLKKANYIKLYERLGGNLDTVKKATANLFANIIQTKTQDINNRKLLNLTLVDQLFQYDLLSKNQIDSIIKNKGLFPNQNTDTWQQSLKWQLEYKSYALNKPGNNSFIPNLPNNTNNPNYVRSVTRRLLKSNDLETAFQITQTIPTDPANNRTKSFIAALNAHIQYTPNGRNRLQIIQEYFKNSSSSTPNNESKNNFQTHLLEALWDIPDKAFANNSEAYDGAKSRREFFNKLDSTMISSPANKDKLQGIKDALKDP